MVIWVLAGYFVTFEQWKISRDVGNKWIFVRSEELQVSFELWRIGDWWWWRIGSAILFSRRFLAKTVRNKTLAIIHVANTDNFVHITPEDTTQKNLFLLCHHHTIKRVSISEVGTDMLQLVSMFMFYSKLIVLE